MLTPEDYDKADDDAPSFALTIHDDGKGDIEFNVHTTSTPDPHIHAPLGMMYGLAILMLDRQGAVEEIVERLLKEGAMNEVECVNHIALLLDQDPDDLPN